METVRGSQLTILFDGKKCIHARACVLGRPDVFVPNVEGEWIHPDAATPEAIAILAHTCPSGAIRYACHEDSPPHVREEQPPVVNLCRVRENGPYAIHADLAITGHGEHLRATLCRCGLSANKPFCDGAHGAGGFAASGEPAAQTSQPLAVRNGRVTVTPAANGPLLVSGSLEIVSGTGRTLERCVETALCRCGHSSNKPFCDGTHEVIGFQAPGEP